jgi:hypothetical protein
VLFVKKIYIFEERSCHAPGADQFIERLQRWYKTTADVRSYDLAAPDELVPLPPDLFFRLQQDGPSCLPALVVNGTVVAEKQLPPFGSAVELIEAEIPVPVASTSRSSSCSAPSQVNGCC